MTKIAVPVVNGKINGHFGQTQQFYVYTVEKNSIIKEEILIPPSYKPGVLPKWLAAKGITDLIVHSMRQKAIAMFNQNKIHVFIGVPVKDPRELVLELLNGILETSDNTFST